MSSCKYMRFKLKGSLWEIRLALRRVGTIKNEIIVDDIKDIPAYLAADHRMDKEEVKKIIHDSNEH